MSFAGIERRIDRECAEVGTQKAKELVDMIANTLGVSTSPFNPDDEFRIAVAALRGLAERRFTQKERQRVWSDAEQAALATLKGMSNRS